MLLKKESATMLNFAPKPELTSEQKLIQRRSNVRVAVTYSACWFVFAVAPFLIFWLLAQGKPDVALTIFNTILPIAAGVISFWFAARSKNPEQSKNDNGAHDQNSGERHHQ